MELFEALARRHTYRGPFMDRPVPRRDLGRVVEAGIRAPSAKNAQTTTFVIVDDPVLVKAIGERHTMAAMRTAKAFIACVCDKAPEPVYEGYAFQEEDCAAAVENMLLALTALGYAGVWVDGWLRINGNGEAVAAALGLPAGKRVQVLIPVGIPAEEHIQRPKKDFTERAWYNRYGQV